MEDAGIYARESEYLGRFVQVGAAGEKVISLTFPTQPDEEAGDDHPLLDRIDAYLTGEPENFADVDVGLTVPTTQRNVLEAVREIPHGEDATVGEVARMTAGLDAGDEADLVTVREALAENPVPLIRAARREG